MPPKKVDPLRASNALGTAWKGVISYFPCLGVNVIHYVVFLCIPSEQEFGGSVEIRRHNVDIPNETE